MLILDVESAEEFGDGRRILLATNVLGDDDVERRYAYVMPKDTIEWRAAEYGLDPDVDLDTIQDIILHERFTEIPPGAGLYDAPTVADARAAILDVVAAARIRRQTARAGRLPAAALAARDQTTADARKEWRRLSYVAPEAIKLKQDIVARGREEQAAERQRADMARNNIPAPEERLRALRSQLEFTERGKAAPTVGRKGIRWI